MFGTTTIPGAIGAPVLGAQTIAPATTLSGGFGYGAPVVSAPVLGAPLMETIAPATTFSGGFGYGAPVVSAPVLGAPVMETFAPATTVLPGAVGFGTTGFAAPAVSYGAPVMGGYGLGEIDKVNAFGQVVERDFYGGFAAPMAVQAAPVMAAPQVQVQEVVRQCVVPSLPQCVSAPQSVHMAYPRVGSRQITKVHGIKRNSAELKGPVTREEVLAVQQGWSNAIKNISRIHKEGGDYIQAAAVAAGELYAYGHSNVLFKPTKASDNQFRPTAESAMSYFVGGNAVDDGHAEDAGFAINGGKGWTDCVYHNHQIELKGGLGLAMGNYVFTCATTGDQTKVEYTFGYTRCDDGKVRIFLHHSSVPYAAAHAPAPVIKEVVVPSKLVDVGYLGDKVDHPFLGA